jgi:hypothetical protein
MRTTLLSVVAVLVLAACQKPAQQPPAGTPPGTELQGGGEGPDVPPDEVSGDPCAGKELPPCPGECTTPPGELAGTACTPDGTKCGSSIGDSCTCTAGKWGCAVHAPLAPGECSLVCR